MTTSLDPPSATPQSRPATLLLATSDAATRALLRKALHVRAVEVVEAADGIEAMALARRLELDVVILDAFLAVQDGISVCARIRALPGIEQPVIAILGLASQRAVELAYVEGADEILAKPLIPSLVRQRVEVLLRRKRAFARLRLLERAVEGAGAGFTILDARSSEYPLVYANPAFLRITGYESAEVLGRNLRLLRGAETDVAASDELRDALLAGRATRVTIRNYRKDATAFWNDLSVTPLLDASGRLTHFAAVQSDVTEQAQLTASRHLDELAADRTRMLEGVLARLEERRRHVETILNGMLAGLIAADSENRVTFANRAALRTLGLSSADCLGRQIVEVFGHSEEMAAMLEEGVAGEARLDFPLISPGGVRLYVGMSVWRAPEELREEIGYLVLFRDLAETLDRQTADSLGIPTTVDPDKAQPTWFPLSEAETPAEPDVQATATEPGESSEDGAGEEELVPLQREAAAPAPHSIVDLLRAALARLADANEGPFRPIQGGEGLPLVLVDRDQIVEALERLVSTAALRAGDAYRLRIRLGTTSAIGERGTREEQFVRVDILFPREAITEEDFAPEAETERRRQHRRLDVATGGQLVLANGGRLMYSPEDRSEKGLTVLLPVAL